MIYVRIELWPRGDRDRSSVLAEAVVINDGSGTETQGNYRWLLSKKGGFGRATQFARGIATNVLRRGEVCGYARKRHNVWKLLRRVLESYD